MSIHTQHAQVEVPVEGSIDPDGMLADTEEACAAVLGISGISGVCLC